MRGLKHTLKSLTITLEVASFTDAWIETWSDSFRLHRPIVASFTDAWIETKASGKTSLRAQVASFTDAWIETEV